MKNINSKADWLFFVTAAAVLFLLPFNGRLLGFFTQDSGKGYLPLSIGLMLVFGFFTGEFTLKKIWDNWAFKGFVFLFSFYAISALFHYDQEKAVEELTKKLSLIVVPFVLLSNRFFFIKHKENLFLIYFAGVILTLLYLDVKGFSFYNAQGVFPFYVKYSVFTHPTYLGSNVLISIIFLFGRIVKKKGSWLKKTLQMILLLALVTHLVLLLSKAVIIAGGIVLLFFFFYLLFKDVKKLLLFIGVFSLPLIVVLLGSTSFVQIKKNVLGRFSSLEHYKKEGAGGTQFRYKISVNAPGIIGKHWLAGVGVGKEHDHLMDFYAKQGWSYALAGGYNSHNQFIQTWISIGVFGVLLLLVLLFAPLFLNEFDGNKMMLFCFLFIFCTEAMLERQAGIVLFVLFYMFSFTLQDSEQKKRKKKGKQKLDVNKASTYEHLLK